MLRIIKYILFILMCFYSADLCYCQQNAPNIYLPVSSVSNNDLTDNPAKLYYTERNNFTLSYTPSSFGLKELNNNNLTTNFRTDSIYHLINLNGSFNNKFINANINYSVCYKLFNKFIPSIKVGYNYISVRNFNNYSYLNIDIGGLVALYDGLTFGFVLTNLNNGNFVENTNFYRQLALFGMEYYLAESFIVNLGTNINIESEFGISVGFISEFHEFGTIGLSYLSNPEMLELNSKIILYSGLNLIYDLNYHNILGITHLFGLSYDFD